jgi:ABC-type uncharacterized transport system involved in gliding motility auxiliary subunit
MRRVGLIGGILVLIVLFFALNMLAGVGLRGARLDLTEGRAFTLTSGSKAIATSFDSKEPIKLTLYYSRKLAQGRPEYQMYYQRVLELLEEYERASKGGIKLETIDPEPFSEAEDKAVAAGLQGTPVSMAGENFYFGLVGTNAVETQETIPLFVPSKERFLEYDISRLLYSLGHPKRKVVGLISSLPINGTFTFDQQTRQPRRVPAWQAMEEARKQFETRPLGSSVKTIPDDVDVVMVVHPKKLDDSTLYAIDQFVMKGGRLLAFVDPLCENDDQQGQSGQPGDRASDFTKLLDAWQVEIAPGKLAADKDLALPVNVGNQRQPERVPFVLWMHLKKGQLAADDPVTGQLESINVGTAGVIRAKAPPAAPVGVAPPPPPPHATIVPLMKTTAKGSEMPAELMAFQPDPKNILKLFTPGTEELVIAARLTGEVPSAFPNGPPPPAENSPVAPPPGPGLTKSNGPINVLLVADADMLSDGLWAQQQQVFNQTFVQKFADNGDFLVNALDNMSGSTDLMSVRARKGEARPFERIETMRNEAHDKYQAEQDALTKELQTTEQELQKLQAAKGADKQFVLSPEQQKKLDEFRAQYLETNKKLRAVRLNLNKDIETLGTKLKFINIGAIPVLVSLGALGLGAIRSARRRASKRA